MDSASRDKLELRQHGKGDTNRENLPNPTDAFYNNHDSDRITRYAVLEEGDDD